MKPSRTVCVNKDFQSKVLSDALNCLPHFRPSWLGMPSFDKALFGLCVEMGFGIPELLEDNVENASQRDVDVFRGEALEDNADCLR